MILLTRLSSTDQLYACAVDVDCVDIASPPQVVPNNEQVIIGGNTSPQIDNRAAYNGAIYDRAVLQCKYTVGHKNVPLYFGP